MTLKYVFALGEERLPGYAALYEFAHIPIDNIFLGKLGIPEFPQRWSSWSRLDDYQDYLKYQKDCRELFGDSIPLAAEFWLWQEPRGIG